MYANQNLAKTLESQPNRNGKNPKLFRLNLGAGKDRISDFISVDIQPDYADVVADLNHRLPFKNNTVTAVIAKNVLEHLVYPDNFLREIHRISIHGATIQFIVPHGDSRNAWIDIQHKRPFYPETFDFIAENYGFMLHNLTVTYHKPTIRSPILPFTIPLLGKKPVEILAKMKVIKH